MGQDQFAGPDYFTEFDPEKFLREMRESAKNNDSANDHDNADTPAGGSSQ